MSGISKPKINLTGQKFGRLTVLGWERKPEAKKSDKSNIGFWKCLCDCGNYIYVKTNALTSGKTKSCGCYHIEQCKEKKKYNEYDLSGIYGIGYTVNGHIPFLFDLDDYDKIKDYTWSYHHGYIRSSIADRQILMHRLVLNIDKEDVEIDHIGHDTTDNRKQALRITNKENHQNCVLASNNKSGVTGVCWDSISNKWHSYIWYNGKTIHLGRFINFNDAVKARKEAEEKYFGEYSYDNSMKQYQEVINGNS